LEGLDAGGSVSVGLQQGAQAAVAQAIIRQRQGGEAVAEALLIGSLKVGKGGDQLFEGEGGSGGT
jgi:hypothetical protein